jgi:hypothetical protein
MTVFSFLLNLINMNFLVVFSIAYKYLIFKVLKIIHRIISLSLNYLSYFDKHLFILKHLS